MVKSVHNCKGYNKEIIDVNQSADGRISRLLFFINVIDKQSFSVYNVLKEMR